MDGRFEYQRRTAQIEQASELDGIYVIRTSESKQRLSTDDTVRSYKNLARVEPVLRTIKSHLRIRPIHHRAADRVRAHIFICILAYYVQWHMCQVLAPLLFDDETISEQRKQRDPVAPASVTDHAQHKKQSRETADRLPLHSFDTLLAELGTRCRHQGRMIGVIDTPLIYRQTEPTALQTLSAELIHLLPV